LGSDDAEPKSNGAGTKPSDYRFYNSSFVIDDTGAVAGVYRKRKLVIFGEYVPLGDIFPFMRHLTPVGENTFTAGEKASEFLLPGLRVKTSVLICFEDVFPNFTREYVKEDTDFLINLTNNGWFGESAAQWQHGANAVFRAIENRVPLVRCANNGLSCMVDEVGRLYDVYFGDTRDIYGAGFKIVKVPLRAPGEKRPLTFYTRHGDVFGWFCVFVSCLHLARGRFLKLKKADA
jgi:apolipoprotein N-acyltransferase